MVTLCLTFWETTKILSKASYILDHPTFPAAHQLCMSVPVSAHVWQCVPSVSLYQQLLLPRGLTVALTSPWWLTRNNEHCFMCYLFISFWRSIYPSPLPVFKWLTCLLNSWIGRVYHFVIALQAELCSFFIVTCCRTFLGPTAQPPKVNWSSFTSSGLTVVTRSPDSSNVTSSTVGTALPKFAIRGMLKTFGLHGVVLDVDSVSEQPLWLLQCREAAMPRYQTKGLQGLFSTLHRHMKRIVLWDFSSS